jgi:hypothetical protein
MRIVLSKLSERGNKNLLQPPFGNMAGFGLNLKLVLYLQSQCLIEILGFLNPPHRQAAKRQAVKKPLFFIKIFKFVRCYNSNKDF